MTAREWFEYIQYRVSHIADMENDLAIMQARSEVKGQSLEPMAVGGGSGDASSELIGVIQASQDLDAYKAQTNREIGVALLVLYGRDNRGGLAKEKDTATADCINAHYLMGMPWREVAKNFGAPDSKDGEQWCKRRAYRGMEYIDRKGLVYLVYC